MALTGTDLELDTPCPVALDRELSDGRYRSWKCGHCDTSVHVLSSMTEKNARKFLAEHEGEKLCITYMMGSDGEVRFQPEPTVVPLSRLRRRAVAGVGLAAALAACTPTEAAEPKPKPVVEAVEEAGEPVQTPDTAVAAKASMSELVSEARDRVAEHEAERVAAELVEAQRVAAELVEATRITEKKLGGSPIAEIGAVPMPGGIMVAPPPAPKPTAKITHRRGGRRITRSK